MSFFNLIGRCCSPLLFLPTGEVAVAAKSVRGIVGIDVDHFTCKVEDNKIVAFRANIKVAFKYEA